MLPAPDQETAHVLLGIPVLLLTQHLMVLCVLHQHIRVPVPMVQERQDLLLGVLVVHRAIVIIN